MSEDADERLRPLERFREYLDLRARLQIAPKLRARIDPSDIVQQTLLRAHERRAQFRGRTETERTAWLRSILATQIADALRKLGRERKIHAHSLEQALRRSSERLNAWLASDRQSPSGQVFHEEDVLRLTGALAKLPEAQRVALELRHLEGLPVPEVCRRMGKSLPAVSGLLHRGLKALRAQMADEA